MMKKSSRLAILSGLMVLLLTLSAVGHTVSAGSIEGNASPRAASYLLSIVSGNATRWVDASTPQKSATYGFQVKNTGDTSLPNCDLQLYPWTFPPEKWSYNFIPSAPFEVNPNDPPKTILLVVYPAADAEAKRYTFQLKGKTGTASNTISINLDVRQYADVTVKAPPPQAGNPGDTLEFNFEIQNTGNGKDKFTITSIETSVASMTPLLKDNLNTTNELAFMKSVVKTVVVVIPYDQKTTEGSAGLQLSMTVISNFNKTQDDVNWTLIQVYHIYDLSLGISPPSAVLLPGDLAEFTITVLNLGNGYDNVSLNVTANFDSSAWTVSLGRNWFNLSAQRTNTTKLKITPPLNALRGSNYKIDVTARSSGPLFPETPVERTEPLSLTIKQVRQLYAPTTIFVAPNQIGPGQVVRFPFNFTNKGNGEDMVNITVLEKPLNWHATLDFFQNIRMQPYVTQEVSLTVQSSINRNETLHQSYYVKLQIINSDRTSVINLTFEIPVQAVYDWEFTVEEPVRGQVNPYARAVHGFTLVFDSLGNIGDDLQLSLGGEYALWGKLDTTALALGYGERRTVRLAMAVPITAEVGREYPLKIIATSQNRPDLVRELSVSVIIIHMDVSVVPAGSIEINAPAWKECKTAIGTRLNLTVTIRNDGTDSVRAVNVRFFDNEVLFAERTTSTISTLKTAKFTVSWDAATLGVHVLLVRLDANNQLGEVNENNNEASCAVKVVAVPAPPPPAPRDWLRTAVTLAAFSAAIVVAAVIIRRRPRVDRELYESIYGRRSPDGQQARLAAERAEVERRAMIRAAEREAPR